MFDSYNFMDVLDDYEKGIDNLTNPFEPTSTKTFLEEILTPYGSESSEKSKNEESKIW